MSWFFKNSSPSSDEQYKRFKHEYNELQIQQFVLWNAVAKVVQKLADTEDAEMLALKISDVETRMSNLDAMSHLLYTSK